jgi:hypothetical protein
VKNSSTQKTPPTLTSITAVYVLADGTVTGGTNAIPTPDFNNYVGHIYSYFALRAICLLALQHNSGLGHLAVEVSKLCAIIHTRTVGFLCTSDCLVAEATTYTTHNKHKRRISILSAGFEPPVPAIKWLQTCTLHRMTAGIGSSYSQRILIHKGNKVDRQKEFIAYTRSCY